MDETGLENELLATNEALPSEEERTYTMILHDEKGDNAVSLYGNTGQDEQDLSWEPTQVTEAELSEIFSGSDNLQNTFGDFDTYMAYIEESSEMIEAQDWFSAEGIDNRGTGEIIGEGEDFGGVDVRNDDDNRQSDGMARQGAYASWMNSEENQALMQKYGIPTEEFTNEKGDRFRWTGTGFARVYKENRTNVQDYVKLAATASLALAVAPLAGGLTGALTNAGLSPALASAASSSIMNMATQIVTTGDIDIGQAILSAAGAYFQEAGLGGLMGDSAVGSALSDATSFVQEKVSTFQDLISTGNSIADAAIQAGGMNMLTSFVASGEINLESALISAVSAGATTAIQNQSMQELLQAGGITSEDEFEAFLSEDDELQQAFIDADVKDPFLNPNYVTIGDGLMQNEAGEVFNYDGDSVGNMSDLDVDGDGVLNANDLEFVEATGEYRAIPQNVQDALNPIDETPALQLQDGNTYYLDAEGNVYTRDQVEWRGGDTNDFVVIGTDTVAGTTATYSQGSDVFYDEDLKIVLRGEDAGIINVGTGNEFTYGEQYSGNQIFDDPTGIPADLGAAQYSGTVRGAPGDPGAEFDVYYNPETNTTYLVNQADPTQVNKIEDTTPEEVQEQTPEDPSDPVDNEDENLTGGEGGGGGNGSPNENEYEEETNVDDSVIDNPLLNNDTTDDPNRTPGSTNPENSNDTVDDNTEETVDETVDDSGEVVDSNGQVVENTGTPSNPNYRQNQLTGLLGGVIGSVSGQNGDTNSSGTEDGEDQGDGDNPDDTTIGDDTGDGGDDSTSTGPGDDEDGTGDPGIDDGTGGNGPGGDGNGGGGLLAGGGNFTPKWGELFKYTDITPAQAKKMAPMYEYIKQTKGMLS